MAPVVAPGAPANPDPPARVAPAALLVGHANSSSELPLHVRRSCAGCWPAYRTRCERSKARLRALASSSVSVFVFTLLRVLLVVLRAAACTASLPDDARALRSEAAFQQHRPCEPNFDVELRPWRCMTSLVFLCLVSVSCVSGHAAPTSAAAAGHFVVDAPASLRYLVLHLLSVLLPAFFVLFLLR